MDDIFGPNHILVSLRWDDGRPLVMKMSVDGS